MTSHHSVQVEYKPNNQYKPGDEATANHDGHDLLCDGYLFKRHRINATSINWLCKSRQGGCPGSITIDSNGRVNRRLEHVQVTKEDATEAKPVHLPYTQLELMALDFQNKVKVRCSNDPTLSVAKIFQTERAKRAFAKKLLVQHMHFRPYSLKEFGLQCFRKNRNPFRPKTDDLGAF